MQTLQALLDEYAGSHTHALNKLLHWICVPPIVWSVIALLWSVPFPAGLQSDIVPVNWATLALIPAQLYYFRLSVGLGTGVLVFNLFLLWITEMLAIAGPLPLWLIALPVFIMAWMGQFVGHAIEGKRPSFFKDLQFLLIGPAWLMASLYRILGLKY